MKKILLIIFTLSLFGLVSCGGGGSNSSSSNFLWVNTEITTITTYYTNKSLSLASNKLLSYNLNSSTQMFTFTCTSYTNSSLTIVSSKKSIYLFKTGNSTYSILSGNITTDFDDLNTALNSMIF